MDFMIEMMNVVRNSTSRFTQTCSSRRRKTVVRDMRSCDAENWAGVGYGRYRVNELDATCFA